MKSFSVMLRGILIGLILFTCAEVWAEDWIGYGTNEIGSYYYNQENVTRLSKGVVRVWNKIVFTEKGVATAVERLGKSYENVAYDISLKEIECSDKKQRWISSNVYSKKGELLRTPPYNMQWESVVPGSLSDVLLQTVCGQPKKGVTK